jgi:Ca2+-transporting ATPase
MHAFNARSLHTTIFDRSFFSNKSIFAACGLSMLLVILTIYTPLGQRIFQTVPLLFTEWLAILVVSSIVVIITEISKLLVTSELEERRSLEQNEKAQAAA